MKNLLALVALVVIPVMHGFSQEEIINPDDCISIKKGDPVDVLGVQHFRVDVKNECDKTLWVELSSTDADGGKTTRCCLKVASGDTNSSNLIESATGKIEWEVTKIEDKP